MCCITLQEDDVLWDGQERGGWHRTSAVSYTHLDVYKRQPLMKDTLLNPVIFFVYMFNRFISFKMCIRDRLFLSVVIGFDQFIV